MGKKLLLYVGLALCITTSIYPQTGSVGIGTSNPHSSAALEIQNNSKGLLLSRMTTAQRNAIVNPAAGLLVFDTDKNCLFLFDGGVWQALAMLGGNNFPLIERGASDGTPGDGFGSTVSISGDYAIIGSSDDTINSIPSQGSAYIFTKQNGSWVEQAKLVASDGAAFDRFGYAVAISGEFAIIGAPFDDVIAPPLFNEFQDRGSVYFFRRNGTVWSQIAKLGGSEPGELDHLGISVSISGNYAIAGASGDDIGSNANQGSAYIYFFNGTSWAQQIKLTASDGGADNIFGKGVTISGDYAVVGSPGFNDFGAAYVYFRFGTNWLNQTKIEDDILTRSTNDFFGDDVCLSGTQLIIGASGFRVNSTLTDAGAVFFYERSGSTWNRLLKFTANDSGTEDRLGQAVSIGSNYAIAGAPADDWGPFNIRGSVYIFKKFNTSWIFDRKIELEGASGSFSFGRRVCADGTNIGIGSFAGFSKGKIYFMNLD